jgi:thiosulfate/3-mercaptopyruvate sulfurtransferase
MKTQVILTLLVAFITGSLICGCAVVTRQEAASRRTMDPIVSTDWLAANSQLANMVIIDIRSPVDYGASHIPGAINEPFVTAFDPCTGPTSEWIVGSVDCLWLQVPDVNDLFAAIGNLGIRPDSRVVIVTAPNPNEPPFFGLANATRVADTLIYAGVNNVAILDGGHPKWVAEGRPTTKEVPELKSVTYKGKVNPAMFVAIDHVQRHLGDAVIIDARDVDVYFGAVVEPFADKAGHIPNAKSLPAPWIWDWSSDGAYTYKDPQTLGTMAAGVIGEPGTVGSQEIIVYCGVGGYASSWWFVLTQVLGYQHVKLYDGSAQEWVKKYDMVVD